jgi:preprotein translocase subunit SecF
VELFRNVNIDWLGKKWYFLGFSLIFSVSGLLSIFFWHGIPQGVDFKGGTKVYVYFSSTPNEAAIRHALDAGGVRDAELQHISSGPLNTNSNEEVISLPLTDTSETSLDNGRSSIQNALKSGYPENPIDDSKTNVEVVGAQVGKQLQKQAFMATMYSLAGMLVYLWFRFELIYGAAAVVAVFHDTLITIGAFSLTNQEITLTVIAAILTLIGYSMNDTIVVFDRIRENLRSQRRDTLSDVVNRSINQTLSRTVLTSGLTFLTVLSLYLFGGEVLHGFSFALVIGILIGTYSSIAVAAPMLVAYQDWRAGREKAASLPAKKSK